MRLLLSALALSASFGIAHAADYYVAPGGVDTGAGDHEHPFATIAQAVAIAKSGDTIWLHTGIYRECIDIKATGAEPLTIAAVRGEKPQIFGSTALVGPLVREHDTVLGLTPNMPDNDGTYNGQLPSGITADGHLFIDDQPVPLDSGFDPQKTGDYTLAKASSGDHSLFVISIRFADGAPGKHRLEWATAHSIIVGETGACPVHLRGLDIAYANGGKQEGVVVLCSPGSIVENCVVRDSVSRGISICSHGTVAHCHVYGHGILGIGSAGGDSKGVPGMRVTNCEIDHNAWNNADTGWEAGGIKLSSAYQAVVEQNNIHDNAAWGIWFDWQCVGNRIADNRCVRNVAGGIFLEASRAGNFIEDNICTDTRRDPHNDWGDGIYSHDSSNAEVVHNLCLHNACYGIRFRLTTDRKLADGELVECSQNAITDNICAGNGIAQISLPSDAPRMRGDVSDRNLVFADGPGAGIARDSVHPNTPLLDLAGWQKLGFDQHSIVAQPIFKDAEHGDFQPGPNAPQARFSPRFAGPVATAP